MDKEFNQSDQDKAVSRRIKTNKKKFDYQINKNKIFIINIYLHLAL